MTSSSDSPLDLSSCATEPIHIPGAIQPHGVLLAARESDLVIVQTSTNAIAQLGIPRSSLIENPLSAILDTGGFDAIQAALATGRPDLESPIDVIIGNRRFDALLHRQDGLLIVELEPALEIQNLARHHRRLQEVLTRIQAVPDLPALYAAVAHAVSELSGYERVMVYKFDADWNGKVVGEALRSEVDSYMGLHFPASDIPEQARLLYSKSWLRIIPTVDYTPAALEPPLNPLTNRPLDLSFAVLRSVSPIHLEYLRNMEVGASMSISLMVEGKLWGLIACHHRTARPLPYSIRAACELFGQVASREIDAKQRELALREQAEAKTIQTRFFDVIAREENFGDALVKYTPQLLEFMSAGGAAIWVGGQCSLVGRTPPRDQVFALLEWLQTLPDSGPIFVTDSLSSLWPQAAQWKDCGSGVLTLKVSRVGNDRVVWFRPEVVTTVTWAGNPHKPVEPGLRLHPRKSFAAWQETVTGRSLPWTEAELQGAQELRLALNALVLRRTERLLKLNAELERKNTDLNSFAYIASHDLREPIRGIHHFTRFLMEDHASTLGEEGARKVTTIASLAEHTDQLLDALSHFSRLGRMELHKREVDLDTVVDKALTSLSASLSAANVEVRRPRKLPTVTCDPVLVHEVFANLIANGIKYNAKPEKWIEITFQDPEAGSDQTGPVFIVADNGIGIRERNLENIFKMFHRLNKDKYGSGTGAGLSIVKSIVERHGGRIWAESTFGEGTTFRFTLA